MNFFQTSLARARALIHHLRGPDAEALDARRISAFVAVSTLFVALLASLGGEWISYATHYYGQAHPVPIGGGGGGGGGGDAPVFATSTPVPGATPIGTPPPTGGQVGSTGIIGPQGGTLPVGGGAGVDGGAEVIFPAGTFSGDVRVNLILTNGVPAAPAPSGSVFIPPTLDITVGGGVSGASAGLFNHEPGHSEQIPMEPVKIKFNLTTVQLGSNAVASIRGGELDARTNEVTTMPTTVVDAGQAIVEITSYGLSKFTLFAIIRPGPALTDPPHGSTSTTLGPLLKWTNPAATGTTSWFQVRVTPFNDDGPGIDLVIGDPPQVSAQQYQIKSPNFGSADPSYVMLPGMSYTWRVRTSTLTTNPTEGDWTAWSDARAFRTPVKASTGITAKAPAEGASVANTRPTLEFASTDNDLFYYEVQVSSDRTFASTPGSPQLWWELIHAALSTPANSYVIPQQFPLAAAKTYFWRVRPRVQGDGDPAAWSATFSFKTP